MASVASMDQPKSRSRGFSMRSDKSAKMDLTETPEEKARGNSIYKSSSKANPNAAINEAQPGVRNLTEASTLSPLREAQHKDVNGNVIVEPDLSNPTRPRFERPLDTIRSFEKAINNGYKRRSSYKAEPSEQTNQFPSRRSSSHFNGMDSSPSPGRHSAAGGGYYGAQRSGSYMEGHNGPQRPRQGHRNVSDGVMYQQSRHYQQQPQGPHQSQDTMHTNGSDSTGPWASGTDPSSENSSIDRNMVNGKQPESYGQNGYGPPIMEEQGAHNAYGSNGYGANGGPNGGPVQAPPGPRKPIALGNSSAAATPGGSLPTPSRPDPNEDKKKGWLKRRFSKKD